MSTKETKKPWKDWAVEFIKRTEKCPGDPSFGLPTELVTEEQFLSTVRASGTHPFRECHFMDDILGAKLPLPDMQPIVTAPPRFTEEDIEKFKKSISGGKTTIDQFKKNLIMYVNMIELREGGVLHIPHQLLHLDTYLKKFFDVAG